MRTRTQKIQTKGNNSFIGYTAERTWDNVKDVLKNLYKNSQVNAGAGYGEDALKMIDALKKSKAGQGWNKAGIEQLEKTFRPSIEQTKEEKTQKGIENIIRTQQQQNALDQQIEEEYSGLSDKQKQVANIIAGVGQVAPTLALSFLPGGQAIAAGTMFGSQSGDTIGNDLLEGKGLAEAQKHGYMQGAKEAVIERLSGGIAGTAKNSGLMRAVTQGLDNKVSNKFVRALLSRTASATGEGLEEVASTVTDPLVRKLAFKDEAMQSVSGQDMLDSFVAGAGTSALIGTAQDVVNGVAKYRDNSARNQIADKTGRTRENVDSTIQAVHDAGGNISARKVLKKLSESDIEEIHNYNQQHADSFIREYTPETANKKRVETKNLRSIVAGIDSTVSDFFNRWKHGRKSGEKMERMFLGEISDTAKSKIETALGHGIEATDFTIDSDTMRHMYKNHGDTQAEIRRGNVPITAQIVEQLPDVIASPDVVRKDSDPKNPEVIVFEKRLNDGTVVYVQGELKARKALNGITMYAIKNRDGIPVRSSENSADLLTSETAEITPLNQNIPQDRDFSNQNGPTSQELRQAWTDKQRLQRSYETLRDKVELSDKEKYDLDGLMKGVVNEESIQGVNRDHVIKLANAKKQLNAVNGVIDAQKKGKRAQRHAEAYDVIERNADSFKNVNLLSAKNMQTERAVEAMFGENSEIGQKYFEPISAHEAQATKAMRAYQQPIKDLKLNRKQYALTHLIGETESDTLVLKRKLAQMESMEAAGRTETQAYRTLYGQTEQLQAQIAENTEAIKSYKQADYDKAVKAVPVFRGIYEELYNQVSDAYVNAGYPPMGYIEGYFPHLGEASDPISNMLQKMGIDVRTVEVPTSISGLTGMFRPGRKWFENAQTRTGVRTRFDAAEGFDRYLKGAMEAVYHTEDIQQLRALNRALREFYSDEGTKQDIRKIENDENLADTVKEEMIKNRLAESSNGVPNIAQWMEQYTNVLAGKRTNFDRWAQDHLGQSKLYKLLQGAENRIAANMVALNPRSWMTNFNPVALASGEVSMKNLSKGMWESVKNSFKGDGFEDQSNFLTNRRGVDALSQSGSEKVVNTLAHPMEIIDMMSSNAVVRGKYYDNIERGMTHEAAIRDADKFAARLMADRSKGQMPLVFENKNAIARIPLQFQLEVNNAMQYMTKDLPKQLSKRGKAALATGMAKYLVGSWAFNELFEMLTGSRVTFDPIDIVSDFIGELMESEDKDDVLDATQNAGRAVLEQLPYISGFLDGGRYPVQSALPDIEGMIRGTVSTPDELSKLLYLIPPVGGSQIKRGIDTVKDYAQGGRFKHSKEGDKLLYSVDNKLEDVGDYAKLAKAFVFGRSSTKEAQAFYSSGNKALSVKDTKLYCDVVESGADGQQAEKTIRGLNEIRQKEYTGEGSDKKKQREMMEYLGEQDLTDDQRQMLYESEYTGKDVNAWLRAKKSLAGNRDYQRLSSENQDAVLEGVARYEYAKNNTHTSSRTKTNSKWKEWSKWYTAEAAGISPETYAMYVKTRDGLKGKQYVDKYGQLKTEAGTKKAKVLAHINTLSINKTQKMLLAYMNGYQLTQREIGMSKNEGRMRVYEYIMSLDVPLAQKKTMLTDAGYFIVGNRVMWK